MFTSCINQVGSFRIQRHFFTRDTLCERNFLLRTKFTAEKVIATNRSKPLGTTLIVAQNSSDTMEVIKQMSLDGFLERISENNQGKGRGVFLPVLVGEEEAGRVSLEFAQQLLEFPSVFVPSEEEKNKAPAGKGLSAVRMHPGLATPEQRTQAVADVTASLKSSGVVKGWRDELYPVVCEFGGPPLFLVERAAASLFGILTFGVHANGFVEMPNGDIKMWVGRRSGSKPTWPGKLDHIAAGGQPHGLTPYENMVKECQEEAGIPLELAQKITPVGYVSYEFQTEVPQKLRRDILFVYDLKLPPDFVPSPVDREVEEFMLWPIEKVAEIVRTSTDFKDNCSLVIIDFLVRKGFIVPEQNGYIQVVKGLRS